MPKISVVVNRGSGSVTDEAEHQISAAFSAPGIDAAVIFVDGGREVEEVARSAALGESELIVAGGGDGTISTVAAEAYGAGKTLGVLPLGTLNNFSKDLGIPQDTASAISVVLAGHTRMIDIGEVNGRSFINNSSIGLYPRMVLRRQKHQRLGRGKWVSAFWASLRMFKLSPFLKVSIKIGDREFLRKTPFVFVGNNEYDMDIYNIGRRIALDEGKLGVYFLHRGGRMGVIGLLVRTVLGTLEQWRDFEIVMTDTISIRTRRRRLHVALDGEVEVMRSPLVYRTRPAALRVIAPKD